MTCYGGNQRLAAPSLGADERLTINVSPAVSFAPGAVQVRVRVEPDADNRAIEVVADSGEFYRSSVVSLDSGPPHTIVMEFRSLPGGTYEVCGTLRDGGGHTRASARQEVIVMSAGSER